jgi:hypothetical protein
MSSNEGTGTQSVDHTTTTEAQGYHMMYNDVELCYNATRVACASRIATCCLEERIATNNPQEDPHESH